MAQQRVAVLDTGQPRRRVPVLVVFWLLVSALPARAQDFRGWFVRGEVGAANIHAGSFSVGSDLDDLWGTARVGRAFGERGLFALDFGVAGSSADGDSRPARPGSSSGHSPEAWCPHTDVWRWGT